MLWCFDVACTLAVSIVGHLYLETGQTGISVELTVVPVGFAIAAADRSLVGLTALERKDNEREKGGQESRERKKKELESLKPIY